MCSRQSRAGWVGQALEWQAGLMLRGGNAAVLLLMATQGRPCCCHPCSTRAEAQLAAAPCAALKQRLQRPPGCRLPFAGAPRAAEPIPRKSTPGGSQAGGRPSPCRAPGLRTARAAPAGAPAHPSAPPRAASATSGAQCLRGVGVACGGCAVVVVVDGWVRWSGVESWRAEGSASDAVR